jgi:hypothetical protein
VPLLIDFNFFSVPRVWARLVLVLCAYFMEGTMMIKGLWLRLWKGLRRLFGVRVQIEPLTEKKILTCKLPRLTSSANTRPTKAPRLTLPASVQPIVEAAAPILVRPRPIYHPRQPLAPAAPVIDTTQKFFIPTVVQKEPSFGVVIQSRQGADLPVLPADMAQKTILISKSAIEQLVTQTRKKQSDS